jgi:hypothetical protein
MILNLNNKFSRSVELYVQKWKVPYLDAVLALCEEYKVEPESIGKFLTKPIIEKLKTEGQTLNLVVKEKNKLPF